MKQVVTIAFSIVFNLALLGQELPEIGVPHLNIHKPEDYKNVGKIWDIASTDSGLTLFASDKGLLEYDGQSWEKHKGSKGFTRTIFSVNDSLLYSGSDLDFGQWTLNDLNQYNYESLYPFKENASQITEEFWDVHKIGDLSIFISFNNIYVYKDKQLTKISAPSRFSGSYQSADKVFVVDEKFGIYSFDGISLKPIYLYQNTQALSIVHVFEQGGELLLVTQQSGLYQLIGDQLQKIKNLVSDRLANDQVFCAELIHDSYYVFGTILNGIYITDKDGNILQHINKQKGLLNNTILDLHFDKHDILWISMDYGIAEVRLFEDVTYVYDQQGYFGTGQTASLSNGIFYLGSNQGLYQIEWDVLKNPLDQPSFTLIDNSAGQVWDLLKVNDQLLCGHDNGLFELTNNRLKAIHTSIGVLDIIQIDRDHILTGTYNGIDVYTKNDSKWEFNHQLDLIKGACYQIENCKNKLWVHIPNYGVISTSLNADYNITDRKIYPIDDFPEDILYMTTVDDEINIVCEQSTYYIDSSTHSFARKPIDPINRSIKNRLPGNNIPSVLNDSFQFIPIYNGFAIKNKFQNDKKKIEDKLLLRKVNIFNRDTTITHPITEAIPYSHNNISITAIVPHQTNVLYRYKIDRYMEDWSEWNNDSEIKLLNLKEGDYRLHLESKEHGRPISSLDIPFTIKPPWYRSLLAYFVYTLWLLVFIYMQYRWQRYKLEKQRKTLKQKEQQSLKEQAEIFSKQHLVKQNELLESKIIELEKKIRSTKIQLVKEAKESQDKTKVIELLGTKLDQLKSSSGLETNKVKEIKRILENYSDTDKKTFQIHMDELNQSFTHKLKSEFPDLTMYDLRLSTYIKTGLSTREIAELMNVLPSSINVSRSRLRKKLQLKAKDDLFSFLEIFYDK